MVASYYFHRGDVIFTEKEEVASQAVCENKNIGSIPNVNVVMSSQQIVKEVIVLFQLPESIIEIQKMNGLSYARLPRPFFG